jgi:hypothetical protein
VLARNCEIKTIWMKLEGYKVKRARKNREEEKEIKMSKLII